MANEIKVNVAARESGLDKVGADAKRTGRGIADDLQKGFNDAGRASDRARQEIGGNLETIGERAKRSVAEMSARWAQADREMEQAGSRAASALGDDFDRIETDARSAGKQVDLSIERGMDGAIRASTKARREISDDLDEISDKAKEVGDSGGHLGESLMEGLSGGLDPSSLLDGLTGSLTGGAAGVATAGFGIGLAIGEQAWKGAESVWAEDKLGGLIAAQNGGTVAQARRVGDLAGAAFYDGFGESIEDVGASLNAVISQGLTDLDAPEAEIKHLGELAETASSVVGEEANQIARAAKQLLVNGLANNAEQAIDIITVASQKGVNASGDLIDTIIEYGTQFRQLGLTGKQAMGLMSQALQSGARDSDTAADALKEFVINAQDVSRPDTVAGFKALGLNAKEMGDNIAAGGDRARGALDETLDRLRAIPDPVTRAQVAVQLFGTKAEDLQGALGGMDLDTVADQMGDLSGATQDAAHTMQATQSPIEKLGKAWDATMNLAAEGLLNLNGLMGKAPTREFSGGFEVMLDSAEAADDGVTGLIESVEELISKNKELQTGVIDLHDAQIGFQEALAAARDRIKENEDGFNLATEAGRENMQTLDDIAGKALDVAEAMDQQNASEKDVTKHMELSRAEFIRSAVQLGMNARQARKLADDLRLIPGNYRAKTSVDTGASMAKARELERYLDAVARDRYMTVHVGAAGAGLGLGGFWGGHAIGGIATGHAAEGGARGGLTVTDEQGPELKRLPDGSMVVPAGMSRAMMSGWMDGGQQGGGSVEAALVFEGDTDSMIATMLAKMVRMKLLRLEVRNGQVVAA